MGVHDVSVLKLCIFMSISGCSTRLITQLHALSFAGQERGGVVRYRKEDDRKRSLLSKLMQRRVASLVLGVPFTEVEIRRTKGRKPYAVAPHGNPSHAPNFNFNVSHEGDWVVLASEGRLLCGVDVAAPEELRSKQVSGLDMRPSLTLAFCRRFKTSI